VGAEKERIISMADCDHREICVYAGRTSNYKKLLGAIRECITLSQRETRRPQGTFPTFFLDKPEVLLTTWFSLFDACGES
jgi:hypothetical protein